MDFDFELLLVCLAALSGAIWLVDGLLWAPKRKSRLLDSDDADEPVIVEYAHSLFPVFIIVLLLRSFIGEPYEIPSGSMKPTLKIGDYIIVNKFSYGVRLPVIDTKILSVGEPKTGDVMVFRYPEDNETNYIKRVIGVPGDRVRYSNKILYINNEPAQQEIIGVAEGQCPGFRGDASERIENLKGIEHRVYVCENVPERTLEFTVPDGKYMVFGDNRDNSNDSRYWGFVPEENLVGKAVMIWFSSDSQYGWFSGERFRWERIGLSIK